MAAYLSQRSSLARLTHTPACNATPMIEFFIIFVFTLVVLIGLALALIFGRGPHYRPDKAQVQRLLTRLLEQNLSQTEWDFFLSMPIHHDAELDGVRQRCVLAYHEFGLRARDGIVRVRQEGVIRLRFVLQQMEQEGSRLF